MTQHCFDNRKQEVNYLSVFQANVYHASSQAGDSKAIKIYKTSILHFRDRDKYVSGEFRWVPPQKKNHFIKKYLEMLVINHRPETFQIPSWLLQREPQEDGQNLG